MALTINTKIKNDADGYSLDAQQVKGTYVVVKDIAERDAIPAATKISGSVVYVSEENKEYRWNGEQWNVVSVLEKPETLPTEDSVPVVDKEGNISYKKISELGGASGGSTIVSAELVPVEE